MHFSILGDQNKIIVALTRARAPAHAHRSFHFQILFAVVLNLHTPFGYIPFCFGFDVVRNRLQYVHRMAEADRQRSFCYDSMMVELTKNVLLQRHRQNGAVLLP